MQSAKWSALLGQIPSDQLDNLMLVTSNGIELAIQSILRTEEEFLVLRARMAGTDIARTLFLPYAHITYLGFQKPVKEAVIRAMYGETAPVAAAAKVEPEAAGPAPEAAQKTQPQTGESAPTSDPEKTNGTPVAAPPPQDKKALLERLRSRSFVGTMKGPPIR